jgi:ParB/RepB/Spo0J family partition protein
MTEITLLPYERIQPGDNDRKVFDPIGLEDLAANIKDAGLISPVVVRPLGLTDFEIICGERRFRAIGLLGWDNVPCHIRQDLSDEQASAIMLMENTARADLNPVEEAEAYQKRVDQFGWTIEQLSLNAGRSGDLISRRLDLLKLAPEIQHLVKHKNIPIGHAESMTSLDLSRQRIALRIFRESKGITLRHFRKIVADLFDEQSQDNLFDIENFWISQVQQQADLPRRGKNASTGAPVRDDLPPVTSESNQSTAEVMEAYIKTLLDKGLTQDAATIGTIYDALVKSNFLGIPEKSVLQTEPTQLSF